MRVPLTTRDFLDRAELVYGDRVGIVDEPNQPAPSLGERELPRGRPPRPGAAGRARRARHRRGRAGGDRQPQRRRGCSSCCSPSRRPGGSRCRSTSGSPRRRSATSSGTPAPGCCWSTPSWSPRSRACEAEHRFGTGEEYEQLLRFDTEPRPWAEPGRGRHRHDQLHQRDDGAAQGRADDPPQHLGQRRHLRHAHAGQRPRRLPAHAADVPLQRLGPAVHDGRARGAAGGAAQGRRRRDPAPGRAARRHDDGRGAGGRGTPSSRPPPTGTARSPAATGCASSSPGRRRRRRRSRGSRPSSAGSSTRSTASPRPRRC